jgi:hypothetical protein
MDKKPMTIQDILEELVDSICADCSPFGREIDSKIAQAKKKIEELFGEWVGEDS